MILIACPSVNELLSDSISSLLIHKRVLGKVVLDPPLLSSKGMEDQISEQQKGNDGHYVPIESSWRWCWATSASRKGHYRRFEHVMSFARGQLACFVETGGQCSWYLTHWLQQPSEFILSAGHWEGAKDSST